MLLPPSRVSSRCLIWISADFGLGESLQIFFCCLVPVSVTLEGHIRGDRTALGRNGMSYDGDGTCPLIPELELGIRRRLGRRSQMVILTVVVYRISIITNVRYDCMPVSDISNV